MATRKKSFLVTCVTESSSIDTNYGTISPRFIEDDFFVRGHDLFKAKVRELKERDLI